VKKFSQRYVNGGALVFCVALPAEPFGPWPERLIGAAQAYAADGARRP
jgi:hypothetical protein